MKTAGERLYRHRRLQATRHTHLPVCSLDSDVAFANLFMFLFMYTLHKLQQFKQIHPVQLDFKRTCGRNTHQSAFSWPPRQHD